MIGGIFCLLMAGINVPFLFTGTGSWLNVASMIFCIIMSMVCFTIDSDY